MKKIIVSIFIIMAPMLFGIGALANTSSDMRGVWVSTVYNLDFPSKATTDSVRLRNEIDEIVKNCVDTGYNTIFLQVRPEADAIYPSTIFPWSRHLTGKNGSAPDGGFDPLSYWVEQCHMNSMEIHAWINPYRITVDGQNEYNSLVWNHPAKQHPEWVVRYSNGNYYFNPGIPEVRKLVVSGVEEILRNYNVDGIHMDDYFYPGSSFEDEQTFLTYNNGQFTNIADWRRDNVNQLVSTLHRITGNYGRVFGISPSGIWDNKASNPLGSNTRGMSSYSQLYADSRTWVRNGWVDYLAPQIYWEFGYSVADYEVLAKWWSDVFSGSSAKLYIGLASYRSAEAKPGSTWYQGSEIAKQMKYNRTSRTIDGEIHFRYSSVNSAPTLRRLIKATYGSYDKEKPIEVFINRRELVSPYPPVVENSRTLVTMREVFEALGAQVYWDNDTYTVTAVRGSDTIVVTIGNPYMYVNGRMVTLDVPAKIINSKTYVPLRVISESFGYSVEWDGVNKCVMITAQ